jgi:hypothetical protein
MSKTRVHRSKEDDDYARSHFVGMEELATKCDLSVAVLVAWQPAGLFPQPTYVTEDGKGWYPRAYATFVPRAVTRKADLRAPFRAEITRARTRMSRTDPAAYGAFLPTPGGENFLSEDAIESNQRDSGAANTVYASARRGFPVC